MFTEINYCRFVQLDPALSAKTEKLSQWKSNNHGGKFLTLINEAASRPGY